MKPKITYFILNWNPCDSIYVLERLNKTLKSLYENSDPNIKKEVYVINQGSTSKGISDIENFRKEYGFNTICMIDNIGISSGINLGFNIARGEIICCLSYDIFVPKGCDISCIDLLNSSDDFYQVIPSDTVSDCPLQRNNSGKELESVIYTEITMCFYKREIIKNIGYYDERWKACYENLDYNTRIALFGKKTIINHKVCIGHDHNTSNQLIGLNKAYEGYINNAIGGGELGVMWAEKWSDLNSDWEKFKVNPNEPNSLTKEQVEQVSEKNKSLIYLGFLQDRKY